MSFISIKFQYPWGGYHSAEPCCPKTKNVPFFKQSRKANWTSILNNLLLTQRSSPLGSAKPRSYDLQPGQLFERIGQWDASEGVSDGRMQLSQALNFSSDIHGASYQGVFAFLAWGASSDIRRLTRQLRLAQKARPPGLIPGFQDQPRGATRALSHSLVKTLRRYSCASSPLRPGLPPLIAAAIVSATIAAAAFTGSAARWA